MKFNTKKCKHLCITNKRNRLLTSYSLGTERILSSTEEKDLEVLISHNLSRHKNIMAKVTRRIQSMETDDRKFNRSIDINR